MSAQDYLLRVSTGTSYDATHHQIIAPNSPTSLTLTSPLMTISLRVRIANYHGLPPGTPASSPYFSTAHHKSDKYSIAFSFLPHTDIPGEDLVFGNDFDEPIRDRLPPGFGTALQIAKWAVDPGLDGDPYSDKPHLYGPALSSINALRVGEKVQGEDIPETVHEDSIEEGGEGSGVDIRKDAGVPDGASERMKHFLNEEKRKEFVFEKGRVYQADFFNGYLDFNGMTAPSHLSSTFDCLLLTTMLISLPFRRLHPQTPRLLLLRSQLHRRENALSPLRAQE